MTANPVCIGQKQRWFLLQLVGDEKNINMNTTKSPEFDGWRLGKFLVSRTSGCVL